MSVLSLITLVLTAKSKNKCEEIEDYLDSIENVYHQGDYINICELNDKGDVIEAFFDSYDDDLSEEDLLPVLKKYNTYEKLLIRNFQLTQKSIDLIKAFPNLTELKIERQHLDTSVNFDNGFKKLTKFHLTVDENELYNIPKAIYTLKNLEKLELKDYNYTKQDFEGIAKLTNLKELIISQSFEIVSTKKIDFSPLKKLTNLTSLSLYNFSKKYPEFINSLTGLKKLYLKTYDELKTIPEGILNLKNLEVLDLNGNKISDLPSNIKNLKNLKILTLSNNAFSKIPDGIKYLTNLKELNLRFNEITKFSSVLESLEKLEILDLSRNKINDKLPEYINNLSNLREINLDQNLNISGRSLTNKNLEVCRYGYSYKDFCSDQKSVCEDYPYDKCINNDDKISTDGTCGKGKGKCPSGKCCSKYGYCGTTDKHCLSGCQSEFGECKQNISTNGKCGKDNGNTKCPDDKCCSKYGYCGTTEKHCLSGCQSEFGKCGNVEEKISNNDKCGSTYGKCPDNKCCSKYGWCGKTSEYCGSGCQSQFGKCL